MTDAARPTRAVPLSAALQACAIVCLLWVTATSSALAQAGGNPTPAPAVRIVEAGATRQFSARVGDADHKAVRWLVNNVIGGSDAVGTISVTGLYTAPSRVPDGGLITISAVAADDETVRASIAVRIVPRRVASAVVTADLAGQASARPWEITTEIRADASVPSAAVPVGMTSVAATPLAVVMAQPPADEQRRAAAPTPSPAAPGSPAPSAPAIPEAVPVAAAVPAVPAVDTPAAVTPPAPEAPPWERRSSLADAVSYDAAVRFLEQTTFGPTRALIAHVQEVGFQAFLDEQFALPPSLYPDVLSPTATSSGTPVSTLQAQFYVNALQEPDQLRQRVAFALQQIFVVSSVRLSRADQFQPWLNMLSANAFGNFRTLLTEVTLSPSMGRYLDMVNNDKGNASGTRRPNENYARELLQLFTIGPNPLSADAPAMTNGLPAGVYTQEHIEELARVFTGWTYPVMPGATPASHNPSYYYGRMVAVPAMHDTGSKTLWGGRVIPAGQTPDQDLQDALDHVFSHPNVGPFICRRLIQHLVKSQPSPSYMSRVVRVFNDNGAGVRGDLKAVVTAILLDPEARSGDHGGPSLPDAGHLREPILLQTGLLRALGAVSDGTAHPGYGATMGQRILSPATVFNYYHADYMLPDGITPAPEFELLTPATAVSRANYIYSLVFGSFSGTTVDWTYWTTLAADTNALLDGLNHFMLHGQMSAEMRSVIATAVTAYPATQPLSRAKQAFYLVATSAAYQIAQ